MLKTGRILWVYPSALELSYLASSYYDLLGVFSLALPAQGPAQGE